MIRLTASESDTSFPKLWKDLDPYFDRIHKRMDPEKGENEGAGAGGDVDEVAEDEVVGGIDLEALMGDAPPEVNRRIKALKKNQLEVTKLEAQFFREMHAIECKYLPLYQPLFDKREEIVNGKYEPNDEECEFSAGSDTENLVASLNKANLDDGKAKEDVEKVTGIPNFWLRIFHNVELLNEITEESDLPVLKHLTDITVDMTAAPSMGFTLNFHFSPNEYFSNSVLTKTYAMNCELDSDDPFSFEGPEIVKCAGCTIDWAKGKNVTVKTIRKKQKHKQRGSIRTISKTVEVPSFFNFFNPPQIPEDPEEIDDEVQVKLTSDFEVGQYIRERIVPRAVLYYTGEALEDEEEECFEEEEEEESEEEEEEDEAPVSKGSKNNKNRKRDTTANEKQNPECKQQ